MTTWLPSEIERDFSRILRGASIVLLHSAPRAIGHVAGGIDAVVEAMVAALDESPAKTLVVPTFTTDRLDPSCWRRHPAPRDRWDAIRDELPTFDPAISTPRRMGRIADLVWRRPGALRTAHPVESIAAIGPRAKWIVEREPIDDPKGPRGPWARMVEADARVVMLGVGLERCTLIHHAERIVGVDYQLPYAFPVEIEGSRAWLEVDASGGSCSDGFGRLLPHLESANALTVDHVGDAPVSIVSARALFDVTCALLRERPHALLCDAADCPQCSPHLDELTTQR
jgi:aminoglycoside 3-N-acetyltransferase